MQRRRRELGLSVAPDERVLPSRSQPSASLPAIDIAIECDANGEEQSSHIALLRAVRRLEELDNETEEEKRHRRSGRALAQLIAAFEQERDAHAFLGVQHQNTDEV